MKLVCPGCGAMIAGGDIDLGRGLGLCRACGELVPLPEAAALARGTASSGATGEAGRIAPGALVTPFGATPESRLYRPESCRVTERVTDGRYEATIPPNRGPALALLAFCAFWDTFMVVWYAIAITGGIWMMAIAGLLHLGVGVFITHKAVVGLFNTRRLVITGGELSWTSKPVPDRGGQLLPIASIEGFAVVQKNTQRSTTFAVGINLANGTQRELDVDATDQPTATYVVERFQEALRTAKEAATEGRGYRG